MIYFVEIEDFHFSTKANTNRTHLFHFYFENGEEKQKENERKFEQIIAANVLLFGSKIILYLINFEFDFDFDFEYFLFFVSLN